MSTLQAERFCLSLTLQGSQPYVVNLAGENDAAACFVPHIREILRLSVAYLACHKRCSCRLCTLHVTKLQRSFTKGAAVCYVPCMWQKCSYQLFTLHVTRGAVVCCVICLWQTVQLSVVYLACDKICSCLLCTLHMTKGAAVCFVPFMWQKEQLSVVYLFCHKRVPLSVYVTNGASVRSVPCRWKSLSPVYFLEAVYLAGEKGPDVGLWDGQGSEDADVRRPEALHSEGGHGQHSQR